MTSLPSQHDTCFEKVVLMLERQHQVVSLTPLGCNLTIKDCET